MTATPDREQLYELAYDVAVRALSEQQQIIESFRSRAGILLSAAAITTSFLGTQALEGARSNWIAWAALASFVGVAGACLRILWPRRWELSANPNVVVEAYMESVDGEFAVSDVNRELSLYMHRSLVKNSAGLEQFFALFQIGSTLLTIEIIIWIVAIATMP